MVDLVRLSLDTNGQVSGTINLWLGLVILLVVVLVVSVVPWGRRLLFRQEFEVDEVELGIGTGKVKLKPNNDDLQVAYKLWVELKTRKLGLLFDENHDVITEVYNSWYEFFKITRELVKSIPVSKIMDQPSTQALVGISIDVLNKAIRPHLTRWQARFRRWYQSQIADAANAALSPQELQRRFPEYAVLVDDLKRTNARLVAYARLLTKVINVDLDGRGESARSQP